MANFQSVKDQTVALAGLYQAVSLVQQCARQGAIGHPIALDASLESVLRIDAPSPEAVFGGPVALRLGLQALEPQLARHMTAERLEQARYAANLMYLERCLSQSSQTREAVANAVTQMQSHRAERPVSDPVMLEQLAKLYVEHISGLGPRVMVSGEPAHLKDPSNASRIRALLLAGLRSAVLWRQCAGGRLKLLLRRGRYLAEVKRLLAEPLW